MVAMRRKDRQVSDEEAMAYLKAAEYGVLSTVGPDGEPYGVPLTYAVEEDGKGLVFHCARDGYKLACFAANPRAHFVAVQETNVLPEEFSIEYKSVMVSGLLEEIEDREEKVRCAQVVGDKYSTISSEEYANRAADKIRVFRLNIEHISGKRLVKAGEPGMGYKKGEQGYCERGKGQPFPLSSFGGIGGRLSPFAFRETGISHRILCAGRMIGLFFKKDERQRWGYGFFGAAGVAVALIQAKIAQALVAGEQFQPGRRTAFFQFLKQTGAKAVSLALGMDHQFSDQQRIPPQSTSNGPYNPPARINCLQEHAVPELFSHFLKRLHEGRNGKVVEQPCLTLIRQPLQLQYCLQVRFLSLNDTVGRKHLQTGHWKSFWRRMEDKRGLLCL